MKWKDQEFLLFELVFAYSFVLDGNYIGLKIKLLMRTVDILVFMAHERGSQKPHNQKKKTFSSSLRVGWLWWVGTAQNLVISLLHNQFLGNKNSGTIVRNHQQLFDFLCISAKITKKRKKYHIFFLDWSSFSLFLLNLFNYSFYLFALYFGLCRQTIHSCFWVDFAGEVFIALGAVFISQIISEQIR